MYNIVSACREGYFIQLWAKCCGASIFIGLSPQDSLWLYRLSKEQLSRTSLEMMFNVA